MAGKIKDKKQEIRDLEGKLARALADYQNLIKRVDREKHEVVIRANKNLLKDILPILDILENAQEHLKDEGLGMAIAQFGEVLERNGLREIKLGKGDKFNEAKHEATQVAEGGETGTIAQILRKGYEWEDGMILRPAQVRVYNGISEKGKELDKELQRGDYV